MPAAAAASAFWYSSPLGTRTRRTVAPGWAAWKRSATACQPIPPGEVSAQWFQNSISPGGSACEPPRSGLGAPAGGQRGAGRGRGRRGREAQQPAVG